jgi:hypothetical protein
VRRKKRGDFQAGVRIERRPGQDSSKESCGVVKKESCEVGYTGERERSKSGVGSGRREDCTRAGATGPKAGLGYIHNVEEQGIIFNTCYFITTNTYQKNKRKLALEYLLNLLPCDPSTWEPYCLATWHVIALNLVTLTSSSASTFSWSFLRHQRQDEGAEAHPTARNAPHRNPHSPIPGELHIEVEK